MSKREWEWSLRDQATMLGLKRGVDLLPAVYERPDLTVRRSTL